MAQSPKSITAIVVMVLFLCPLYRSASVFCPAGTYVFKTRYGTVACDDCPRETYMPDDNHTHTQCYRCTEMADSTKEIQTAACNRIQDSVIECKEGYYRRPTFIEWQTRYTCEQCTEIVDPDVEILIKECNKTQNTVIHCVKGYYRKFPHDDREKERCEKCTKCSDHGFHMMGACQPYRDTQCCLDSHFVVHPDKSGLDLCWETPWLCRQGQYFDKDYHSCKPCPNGTYMNSDYHIMTKCSPCPPVTKPYHLPKYAVLISPCNKTHPPLIECQQGFYIKYGFGDNDEDFGCSRCKMCDENEGQYEGRGCDRFHDTVCCPQPNMTVSEDGSKCIQIVSSSEMQINKSEISHENNGSDPIDLQQNSTMSKSPDEHDNVDDETLKDSDLDEDNKGHPERETPYIIIAVFMVIILAMIVFLVVQNRRGGWPFKPRRHYDRRDENRMEDGEGATEMTGLLADTDDSQGTIQPEQEIFVYRPDEHMEYAPCRVELYLTTLSKPNKHLYEFDGCLAFSGNGGMTLQLCHIDDRNRLKSPKTFIWNVSILDKDGQKRDVVGEKVIEDKSALQQEDKQRNNPNCFTMSQEQLVDLYQNLDPKQPIRVKWGVQVNDDVSSVVNSCTMSPS